ncbi:MAG: type IV secretion system protein, partial [Rickettsiales bacterium]|nr:type IV secretion system protein [Rickettsiales bacterium]
LFVACVLGMLAMPANAEDPPAEIPDGTCTSQPEIFGITEPETGTGLISSIIYELTEPLEAVAQTMFEAIAGDEGFKNVLRLASSIYVAIYGIFFTFGMVQITIHDLLVRLVKIGIINTLISANAWAFFYDTVVYFFNTGTDDIILRVSSIAIGTPTNAGPLIGAPFDPLDQALVYVVSSKMAVTLLATFATGPYGFIIGLILVMSLGSFLKSIFNALWVYVMGYVIRTIMFGLAPLFIVCILFSRTRHLFDGWLNQIVNSCLQPIFLFTFFAFFVLLVKSCLITLLDWPVCWVPTTYTTGTPGVAHFWRFGLMLCGQKYPDGSQIYEAFDGEWSFQGPVNLPAKFNCNANIIHPIGIMLPLIVWILADLGSRFNQIVVEIAKDLSSAGTDLGMGADGIKKWFDKVTSDAPKPPGGAAGGAAAGNRFDPARLTSLVSGEATGRGPGVQATGDNPFANRNPLAGVRGGPGGGPPPVGGGR